VETDVSKDVDKSKHLLVTSGVHVMGYLNLFSDAVVGSLSVSLNLIVDVKALQFSLLI
jgi:hypothetical protein